MDILLKEIEDAVSCYRKLIDGGSMSDDELAAFIKVGGMTEAFLGMLGKEFAFSYREIRNLTDRAGDYQTARRLHL